MSGNVKKIEYGGRGGDNPDKEIFIFNISVLLSELLCAF